MPRFSNDRLYTLVLLKRGGYALFVLAWVLASAPPLHAKNQEPSVVSWYNSPAAAKHTVIFVHGRDPLTTHSPRLLEVGSFDRANLGWQPKPSNSNDYWEVVGKVYPDPHVCQAQALSAEDQYRCRMRIDVKGYWQTLGAKSKLDFGLDGLMAQMARNEDFRSFSGDFNIGLKKKPIGRYENPFNPGRYTEYIGQFGQYVCHNPLFSFTGGDPATSNTTNIKDCVYPGSGDPATRRAWSSEAGGSRSYDGSTHRTTEAGSAVQTLYGPDAVLPGATTYYLKNAVFVGYEGDSDPTNTSDSYGALKQLDKAMWNYCDSAAGKTCTIVCHSAGCLVTGMYLALGWGPGYHNQSGLIEVVTTNSAAGGSQIALKAREFKNAAPSWLRGLLGLSNGDIYTPMIQKLVPTTAMGAYTHGKQSFAYQAVPVYYLAGSRTDLSSTVRDLLDWNGGVANDGAVSLRSQCAGLGTSDDAYTNVPGYGYGLDAGVCRFYSQNRQAAGYGYGTFFPAMDWYSQIAVQTHGCDQDLKTCWKTHPEGKRIAVQWMTDVK